MINVFGFYERQIQRDSSTIRHCLMSAVDWMLHSSISIAQDETSTAIPSIRCLTTKENMYWYHSFNFFFTSRDSKLMQSSNPIGNLCATLANDSDLIRVRWAGDSSTSSWVHGLSKSCSSCSDDNRSSPSIGADSWLSWSDTTRKRVNRDMFGIVDIRLRQRLRWRNETASSSPSGAAISLQADISKRWSIDMPRNDGATVSRSLEHNSMNCKWCKCWTPVGCARKSQPLATKLFSCFKQLMSPISDKK